MATDLFHVVTWNTNGQQDMQRGACFSIRPDAEQHAAKIESVMGARLGITIATTSECQRLGI